MRYAFCFSIAALVAGAALAGCAASKSSNPLSPSVAGPIPGVNISAPKPLEPAGGQNVAVDNQPVTLVLENASTNGARPLTYLVEIATDANFNNKVFVRDGITPADGTKTGMRLPDPLSTGRAYYWRARAEDGANTGPYSNAAHFTVYTPIVIDQPKLLSPIGNARVENLHPRLTLANAPRSGPVGSISYLIELGTTDTFANKVAVWLVGEQPGNTSLDSPQDLSYSTQYFWHARAFDSTTTGPWSATEVFQTLAPPPPPPIPIPVPGPGGPAPSPGDAIDLRGVTIVKGPAVSNWAVGATITAVQQGGGQLCIAHTRLGQWPAVPFFGDPGTLVEGNQWVFMLKDGRWFGGAADWYRPGQACKGVDAGSVGRDAFSEEPLHSWVPQPGELFGVMATTPARAWPDMRTLDQRTNVVTLRWQ